MNILILGGTRFTGPHTVRRLIDRGHDVTVFHRGTSKIALPPAVRHIVGLKANLSDFAGAFRSLSPDVVVNMIAFTQEDALTFVEIFRGIARRAVVISSIDVYRAYGRLLRTEPGPPDPAPLTEDSPLREQLSMHGTDYDKTAVERVVMGEPDLPATVLRFPAVYGPHDPLHRLYPFVRRIDDGRPAILLDESLANWRFTHGYVEDVAYATMLAAIDERAAGRIYNVGEQDMPPWAEWIRRIGHAAEWHGPVISLPGEQLPESLRNGSDTAQDWVVDTRRIRAELGYEEQTPQAEALRRAIAWERANPPVEIDPNQFDYAAEDAALDTVSPR